MSFRFTFCSYKCFKLFDTFVICCLCHSTIIPILFLLIYVNSPLPFEPHSPTRHFFGSFFIRPVPYSIYIDEKAAVFHREITIYTWNMDMHGQHVDGNSSLSISNFDSNFIACLFEMREKWIKKMRKKKLCSTNPSTNRVFLDNFVLILMFPAKFHSQ